MVWSISNESKRHLRDEHLHRWPPLSSGWFQLFSLLRSSFWHVAVIVCELQQLAHDVTKVHAWRLTLARPVLCGCSETQRQQAADITFFIGANGRPPMCMRHCVVVSLFPHLGIQLSFKCYEISWRYWRLVTVPVSLLWLLWDINRWGWELSTWSWPWCYLTRWKHCLTGSHLACGAVG